MLCTQCGDEIIGRPVRQGEDLFCSLECANLFSGVFTEEEDGYYEESSLDEYFEEDE